MVYPGDLRLLEWENRFKDSILPVTRSMQAEFVMDADMPLLTDETKGFPLQNAMHTDWDDGRSRRLYLTDGGRKVAAYSIYDGRGVSVHIDAALGSDFAFMFRPWHYIHIEDALLYNNALILHSASIIYKGGAIAFSAPSGTGKTTQTDLWHKYRDGVSDLNGDRTLLQRVDVGGDAYGLPYGRCESGDRYLACGFPIFGGSMRFIQEAVPIHAIVVVRRASIDSVRKLNDLEKITALYSECTVFSYYRKNVERAFDFLEDFIKSVNVIELSCTMNESAVDVLEEALFGTV